MSAVFIDIVLLNVPDTSNRCELTTLHTKSCEWLVELGSLEDHSATCDFTLPPCPYPHGVEALLVW